MTEEDRQARQNGLMSIKKPRLRPLHMVYKEEGRPEGRAGDHWLRAEREIGKPDRPTSLNPSQVDQVFGDHGGER